MLQLRGGLPRAVLGEPRCLFAVSGTGAGVLRWAQRACGAAPGVFGAQRERAEEQAKGWALWRELRCLDRCVLLPLPRFYGVLLGSVCVLYLLPLCWVLAILNSTLFLGNTQFYQGESPVWDGLGKGPVKPGILAWSSPRALV